MRHPPAVPAATLAVLAALASAPLAAQSPADTVPLEEAPLTVPTEGLLAHVSQRGRELAEYDRAALAATAALRRAGPDLTRVQAYVARRTGTGWAVAFGTLSAGGDTFHVAYEAMPTAAADRFDVVTHAPARAAVGREAAAARALLLATSELEAQDRPYNSAVLPAPNGQWWVYSYPAQTTLGVFPHGGDVRWRVAPDGRRILEMRRMHVGVLEAPPPPQGVEAGSHSAVLDDVPEDTDVFYVLTRQPRLPEIVVTRNYLYRIHPDGSISWQRR